MSLARAALTQLAHTLTELGDTATPTCTLASLSAAHPESALLIIGAATADRHLPVVVKLPDEAPKLTNTILSEELVDAIDRLNRTAVGGDPEALWQPELTTWTTTLSSVMLPDTLQAWLVAGNTRLIAVVHPATGFLPLEALDVDGTPLGVRAAIARLATPHTQRRPQELSHVSCHFDTALEWVADRAALERAAARLHHRSSLGVGIGGTNGWSEDLLGAYRLIVIGCHGEAAESFAGRLVDTDGTVVVSAADVLGTSLAGSVLLLETCWSGRHLARRGGEPLSMTAAALVAGAAAVISSGYALPANPQCTGRIVAEIIDGLTASTASESAVGLEPAEAVRAARAAYLADPPKKLAVPGRPGLTMSGTAPWAWSSLVVTT